MTDIRPYRISVTDEVIADLKNRLSLTRLPEAETVDDWTQGIPLNYMREINDYWRDTYDWRAREAMINSRAQFLTEIDGLDVHFIHVRSAHENARPLVLTHGWPGSIVEFLKVIDPLTDPQNHGGTGSDAFHVVIPSLPGFGFSGKPSSVGWGVPKIATAWNELMNRLGYSKYLAQGGDWGAGVTAALAVLCPENCIGIHTNMPTVGPDRDTMDDLTPLEEEALRLGRFYQEWDSGYSKEQSTRPQTLGYGLVDSPIGQAAWILEKFYQWTDCNGHPENAITRDELLDNVMMYWLTASGASSARIYWESFGKGGPGGNIEVPSGCSIFPKEISKASERWVKRRFKDLRYYNVTEKGGHFAAFEQPDIFVAELRKCFDLMR